MHLPSRWRPSLRFWILVLTVLILWVASPNRLVHHYSAALVGLAPLFVICDRVSWRQQLGISFVVWFCFCLYVFTPDLITVQVIQWHEILGGIVVAPLLPLFYVAATLLSLCWTRHLSLLIRPFAMAAIWTGLDGLMGLIWFPIPFHWGSLLFDWTAGIQIADLMGIWGVTYVAVFCNACLACAWQVGWRQGWRVLAVGLGIGSLILSYGWLRLDQISTALRQDSPPAYVVGAVQQVGWLESDRSWPYRAERYRDLFNLSRAATLAGAELVIWPEGALRAQFTGTQLEPYILNPMTQMLSPTAGLLLGATEPDPRTRSLPDQDQRFINSALLYSADGSRLDQFGKQWIFPYFESARYVPSADGYRPLQGENLGRLGVMICLESVLPRPSYALVQAGAQVLITIADDSWFGNSHWPMLHGNLSIFRAIETRRSFVFVNNTGGNMIVDPTGQVQVRGDIFARDVITGTVYLRDGLTLATHLGDSFSYLMLGITLLLGAQTARGRRQPLPDPDTPLLT